MILETCSQGNCWRKRSMHRTKTKTTILIAASLNLPKLLIGHGNPRPDLDKFKYILDAQASLSLYSSTYPGRSVSPSVVHTFGFPFCQRLWDLTKRRDDIVVADMVADMVAVMEVDMVADMEVDKVADMGVYCKGLLSAICRNLILHKRGGWLCLHQRIFYCTKYKQILCQRLTTTNMFFINRVPK